MIWAAAVLGLSSGVYCLGGCLPVMTPLMFGEKTTWRSRAKSFTLFSAGRLAAYLLFGLAAALLGGACPPALVRGAAVASMLLLAPLLVFYGLRGHAQSRCSAGLVKRNLGGLSRSAPLMGFMTGINVCPPFLLALSSVVLVGNPLHGALFFLVFFAATSLYLVPLVFLAHFAAHQPVRAVGRFFSLLAGGFFLLTGIGLVL